ncbi:hypothetical protein Prudu_016768, partial [Prunus dulcis]
VLDLADSTASSSLFGLSLQEIKINKMAVGRVFVPNKTLVSSPKFPTAGVVLPPITKRPAGRPPTKRIKVFGEFKRPLKCSRCSVAGHNRKTCKAII